MTSAQIIVAAALQGLAEIFPLSPEGHAVLIESGLGWPSMSPILGLSVRIGALLGIAAYFWRDLVEMVGGIARALKGKRDTGAILAAQIAVAAVPTLAIGFLVTRYVEFDLHFLTMIGWATLAGALVLLVFDYLGMTVKRVEHATYGDAIFIGLMQVFVLVPGVGRLVMSMTMARLLGYERAAAARLSLLLSLPILAAHTALDAINIGASQLAQISSIELIGGFAGFFSAIIFIAVLLTWLKQSSFTPIVVLRLLIGGVVLAMAYGWLPT